MSMGERRDSEAPGAQPLVIEERTDSQVQVASALDPDSQGGQRAEKRFEVTWAVDCASEDTFLYAYITNVSAMGLFVRTEHPLAVGTRVHLCFSPGGGPPFELEGEVAWINPHHTLRANINPGMGIRFLNLHADERERL